MQTKTALLDLYERNGFIPHWHSADRLAALHTELLQLADDGLVLDDYGYALNAQPPTQVCDELRISSEYMLALEHLRAGRLPQASFERQWRDTAALPAPATDLVDVAVAGFANVQTAFTIARPTLPLYIELRSVYRQMEKQPASRTPIPAGPTIRPGGDDARMPMLVERLRSEGYLVSSGGSDNALSPLRYGTDIQQAVIRFQANHGLQVDGLVGVQTLAALNVSPRQRLNQVRINLERLRWLASQRGDYMLLVNIAGGDIRLFRGEEIVWQSRIISGRPERPTPALISRINRISLNPGWTVPPTIFREDKLPQIREDLAFLQQDDLQVFDANGVPVDPAQVNWSNPAGIMLRQPPGPTNPLGKIALRFPNPFSVYLHDTPGQNLFANAARNVSSGCVRVQDVSGLAAHLLTEKTEAELERITALQATGETHEISLSSGPQLILAYWTAEAAGDGRVRYLRDPYDRDAELLSAFGAMDAASGTPAPAAAACSM